jgi:hypothetical protein
VDGNIFNSRGVHVGMVVGSSIFDLRGQRLYDLKGTNVYKLSTGGCFLFKPDRISPSNSSPRRTASIPRWSVRDFGWRFFRRTSPQPIK